MPYCICEHSAWKKVKNPSFQLHRRTHYQCILVEVYDLRNHFYARTFKYKCTNNSVLSIKLNNQKPQLKLIYIRAKANFSLIFATTQCKH